MANGRPMLGDIDLQLVQKIETDEDEVLIQHGVPALEGDFLQRQKRRATQITLSGVLTGPEAGEGLKTLRDKFRAAEPVPFVADIATAVRVDQMLIEEMGVRELAGKPERFEYAFTLREYIPAEEVDTVDPPPDPDPPEDPSDDIEDNVGTLVVEVIVEGQPNFDFSQVTVTAQGTTQEGETLSRTLSNREGNVWTEEDIPASQGEYSITAVTSGPPALSGSGTTTVQAGQVASVTIRLRSGVTIAKAFVIHFKFNKAFVEPCMRLVMNQVATYAANHPQEKLLIVGHTDKVGDQAMTPPLYNQSLSERRARAAFAYLTFGHNPQEAIDEWNQLRQQRTTGQRLSLNDSWGVYEYQQMLQDLGFYPGNIDGDHGSQTDAAVEDFRAANGLPPGQTVDDDTWTALITAYLVKDNLQIPLDRFFTNCPGEMLKWLGCGEESPTTKWGTPPRGIAWRPYRRTEFLFVQADALPCNVPQPDTFNLPQAGAIASDWCVGPTTPQSPRCCFISYDEPSEAEQSNRWWVQPAEPGNITAQGTIRFENFSPQTAINFSYVLITPDGEFVDGERSTGESLGQAVLGTTDVQGVFEHQFIYPEKPIGVYTLEIKGLYVARLTEDPPSAAKGSVVCKRLDDASNFGVVVVPIDFVPAALEFVSSTEVEQLLGDISVGGNVRLRADLPGISGDEIIVEIHSTAVSSTPPAPTPVPSPTPLEFVEPANPDAAVESISISETVRLRADIPNITQDQIVIELVSHSP